MDFMQEALRQANIALGFDEVPVGAVIVKDNKVISAAYNLRETRNDPTAHAEILAIREAGRFLNSWRLSDCSMYVTLEPCVMCAGAIIQSRIRNIYIGAPDIDRGACGSTVNLLQNQYLQSCINVKWMYNEECSILISNFFREKRLKNIKPTI